MRKKAEGRESPKKQILFENAQLNLIYIYIHIYANSQVLKFRTRICKNQQNSNHIDRVTKQTNIPMPRFIK